MQSSPQIDFPSTDEEFQAAIRSLQVSAQALQRQTRVLNAQSTHLSRQLPTKGIECERRTNHDSYFLQRETAEVQHVTFAVSSSIHCPSNVMLMAAKECATSGTATIGSPA